MKHIKRDGVVYAIFHKKEDWKEGSHFLTPDEAFIQMGTWLYDQGKELKAHRHIENCRQINLTQEIIIVISGGIQVDLYDQDNIFHSERLETGDLAILLDGGHGYRILADNTRIVEVKNGPFISVEKDKVLIN